MDVLQKEIDEVYATHPTAHEALDNGIVEQHQQFVRSLTEVNGVLSFPIFRTGKVTLLSIRGRISWDLLPKRRL